MFRTTLLALALAAASHAAPAVTVDGNLGTKFCVSTANSSGMPARIAAVGSGSISVNDLTLVVGTVPVGEFFVLVVGRSTTQAPFGNGTLCVTGHTILTPPRIAVARVVELRLSVPTAPITIGSHHFQCWFRDHDAGGKQYDSSDGLSIVFTP